MKKIIQKVWKLRFVFFINWKLWRARHGHTNRQYNFFLQLFVFVIIWANIISYKIYLHCEKIQSLEIRIVKIFLLCFMNIIWTISSILQKHWIIYLIQYKHLKKMCNWTVWYRKAACRIFTICTRMYLLLSWGYGKGSNQCLVIIQSYVYKNICLSFYF